MTMGLASIAGSVLLAFLAATATAQDDTSEDQITCYGVGGRAYRDNVLCPGSKTCCNAVEKCMPNRLCRGDDLPDNVFIRAPCSTNPYDDEECAQICLYNESTEGGILPRVSVCDDGSFCCSNDANCCSRGRGTFLDERGNVISRPESSSSSSESTATSSASSADPSSADPSSTGPASTALEASTTSGSLPDETSTGAEPSESSDSDDNLALKVGLGLGIPLVAIVSGLGVWFFLRRKKKTAEGSESGQLNPKAESTPGSTYAYTHGHSPQPQGHLQAPPGQYQVSELDTPQAHELQGTNSVNQTRAELH